MQDTEYANLTDPEKHFMETMNKKPFLFILEFRQKAPSAEDCETWGLSVSRLDYLAGEVAKHQTRHERLMALEGRGMGARAISETVKRALIIRLKANVFAAEKALADAKATLAMVEKLP